MAKDKRAVTKTSKSKQIKRSNDEIIAAPANAIPKEPAVPLSLQQKCLDLFTKALEPTVDDATLLQEVKAHLFNRDFSAAFGQPAYLKVYASRWSPSRALGYLHIFEGMASHLMRSEDGNYEKHDFLRVICLGGGAGAEVVAIAGWLNFHAEPVKVEAHLIDVAAWAPIVDELHQKSITMPELSQYASVAAKEANRPLVDQQAFSCRLHQQDVLNWAESDMRSVVMPETSLVTLFFTLNELYSTSVAKTQHLLAQLTSIMPAGSHLLVVDSPGSYSTVSLNGAEKRYPMLWLLDYELLKEGSTREGPKWEKVISDDSRWFRLPTGLRYPIELENMRYQIHLYRRLGVAGIM